MTEQLGSLVTQTIYVCLVLVGATLLVSGITNGVAYLFRRRRRQLEEEVAKLEEERTENGSKIAKCVTIHHSRTPAWLINIAEAKLQGRVLGKRTEDTLVAVGVQKKGEEDSKKYDADNDAVDDAKAANGVHTERVEETMDVGCDE